tara:strand:+ start:294 stop:551 length:258 start_codon:yes stop_codon:yes gene_type:complete
MKKYLNQTTVNVVAIVTAVVTGVALLGVGQGPDKEMKKQLLMNRQLDYDLGRVKTCGEMKRYGVDIHPDAPMHYLCADVILTGNE